MPSALTTWAVMQAFMNINVTIKAEVLFAFWTSNTKAGFVSCVINSEKEVSQRSDATCYIGKDIPHMQPVKSWKHGQGLYMTSMNNVVLFGRCSYSFPVIFIIKGWAKFLVHLFTLIAFSLPSLFYYCLFLEGIRCLSFSHHLTYSNLDSSPLK